MLHTIVFLFDENEIEFLLSLNKVYDHSNQILFGLYEIAQIKVTAEGEYISYGYVWNETSNKIQKICFDSPRKITYFVNTSTNSNSSDFLTISQFKCFKTGSSIHNNIIDNRTIQSLIKHPDNVIHLFLTNENSSSNNVINDLVNEHKLINVVTFKDKDFDPAIKSKIIKKCIEYFQTTSNEKIVIKNDAPKTHSNQRMTVIERSDIGNNLISEKIDKLLSISGNIIIEKFMVSLMMNNVYHRMRVYYQKTEKVMNTISDLFFHFSENEIVHTGTSQIFINYFVNDSLKKQIFDFCDKYFEKINIYLNKYDKTHENLLLGFDFLIKSDNTLYCIGVKNVSSMQCALSVLCTTTLNPLEDFFNYVIEKSYDYMLNNKNIIIIGYGCYPRLELFRCCKKRNMNIILVDGSFKEQVIDYVDPKLFIKADLYNVDGYAKEVERISNFFLENKLEIFAIVAVYEDYIPFKILLQEKLGMKKNYLTSYSDSLSNRDKIMSYEKISNFKLTSLKDHLCFSKSYSFSANYTEINDENIKSINIEKPKIMKLSTSSSAFGATKVLNNIDLVTSYNKVKQLLKNTPHDFGCGTNFNPKIFLSDLYEGSEHDIDLIIANGKCIFYVISDNTPIDVTLDESFYEKGCVMPSKIITGHYENEMIKNIVVMSLNQLNLTHGNFNVEFMYTKLGIKIIDVNPRPAGYYNNDWIKKLYGVCTYKYEVLLNSDINDIILKYQTRDFIVGKAIYEKKELDNNDYQFVLYLVEEPIIGNGVDMIAMASNLNHKY